MDYSELAHWVAFFRLHGWPDVRQEFYGAQLASLMLSVVSSKGKQYSADDFMLDEILQTPEEKGENELIAHLDAMIEKQNAGT